MANGVMKMIWKVALRRLLEHSQEDTLLDLDLGGY